MSSATHVDPAPEGTMELRALQSQATAVIENYTANNGIALDHFFALAKLYEEVGEYTQAFLASKGMSAKAKMRPVDAARRAMHDELADILGLVLVNAELLSLDLEAAFLEKWTSGNQSALK